MAIIQDMLPELALTAPIITSPPTPPATFPAAFTAIATSAAASAAFANPADDIKGLNKQQLSKALNQALAKLADEATDRVSITAENEKLKKELTSLAEQSRSQAHRIGSLTNDIEKRDVMMQHQMGTFRCSAGIRMGIQEPSYFELFEASTKAALAQQVVNAQSEENAKMMELLELKNQQVAQLKANYSSLETTLIESVDINSRAKDLIERVNNDCATKIAELQAVTVELQLAQEDLSFSESRIETLQQQNGAMEERLHRAGSKDAEFAELCRDLSSCRVDLGSAQSELVSTQTSLDEQSSKLAEVTREKNNLATIFANLKTTLDMRDSEFDDLKATITATIEADKATIEEKQQMIDALVRQNKELSAQASSAAEGREDANNWAARAEKAHRHLQDAINIHEETKAKSAATIAGLNTANSQLKTDTEKAWATMGNFKMMAQALTGEKKDLEAEVVGITSQLEEATSKYGMLKEDYSKLQQECDALTSKLAAPIACECTAEAKAMQSQYEQHVQHFEQSATSVFNDLNQKVTNLKQQLDAKTRELDFKQDMLERGIGEELRSMVMSHRQRALLKVRSSGVRK